MKTDIEISRETKLLPIKEVAKKIGLLEEQLEYYGPFKAKITNKKNIEKKGKLILVTSINPTPFGEGKTTMSIGLQDAFCKLQKNSIVVLREPSLGPVFGIKGGATGGGYAQVAPMEDINLHFTGDMHAITSANNLLCAAIDNHLFQGNELQIDENTILCPRCMDMNDRSLRQIEVGLGDKNGVERKDSFVITVATEIMAILCLSSDLMDLKRRLENILVAYNKDKKPIYVRDLNCADAMTILLKDAIKPNLVQTLEGNPAIIHGGPFANIAHGCNSIIATKLGLSLCDYVITEAGFGSDLGAEKFFDIKCRIGNLNPDAVVVNATVRSLKYNGLCPKEELKIPNLDYLKKGIINLQIHLENMKKYLNNVVVCINQFDTDSKEEIDYIINYCKNLGFPVACSKAFEKGGEGSIDLANLVLEELKTPADFKLLYEDSLSIKEKIKKVTSEIYRMSDVIFEEQAKKQLLELERLGVQSLPICIAKTQYSISDDPKALGDARRKIGTVREIKLSNGAGFIVVYMGNIMTMPGLSKTAAYLSMHIDSDENIKGLF